MSETRGRGSDGGGARGGGGGVLYSDKLKTNVRHDQMLNRNILEITLDKEESANSHIDGDDVYNLFLKLGIKVQSEVCGYQVYPGYPFHMEVWMAI